MRIHTKENRLRGVGLINRNPETGPIFRTNSELFICRFQVERAPAALRHARLVDIESVSHHRCKFVDGVQRKLQANRQ